MDIITNNLVEDNLKLVYYVIEEFTNKQYTKDNIFLDEDDLYQIGCLGLTKAAKAFDLNKGASFSSFAVTCIRNEIYLALKTQTHHEDTSDFQFDKGKALEDCIDLEDQDQSAEYNFLLESLIDDLSNCVSSKARSDAKNILGLLSMGYKESETAKLLGITPGRVYRILNKIRSVARNS